MGLQHTYDDIEILDIQQKRSSSSLLDDIRAKLRAEEGKEKQLPTILLYDERGLKLFEEITFLEEYYLTNAEIEALETHSDRIAEEVPSDVQIIELGSGNLRKVSILLHALERAGKTVEYYALDLSLPELKRSLSAIDNTDYQHVTFRGLHGTYEDGLAWLKLPENARRSNLIFFLGSSIGNFSRTDAASFLRSFSAVLGPTSKMLIGLDACQDRDRVYHAYNDHAGKTREFYLNGLVHANSQFGKEVFRLEDWDVIGEYDEIEQRHQAFYTPLVDVTIEGVLIRAGERLRFEESYKYSRSQSADLWNHAGLAAQATYGNSTDDYHLHLLTLPPPAFALDAATYAARPVPSVEEFEQLWAVWDFLTTKLIPKQELLSKPIRLRNCCLFYLGHIPTFLDIHVSRSIQGVPTEPAFFRQIFERGIDPDVDNPEKCHQHSEIPDTWPPVEEILAFRDRVRKRVISLFETGTVDANRALGRSLWLSFEHEAMHAETLLYMLIQSDKVLSPGPAPDFKSLSEIARREAVPNKWIQVPSALLTVGLDDPDDDLSFDRYFGWDNEKPKRQIEVSSFEAKARPLSNEDFARYLEQTQQQDLPALWASSGDINNETVPETQGHYGGNGTLPTGDGQPQNPTEVFLRDKYVKTMYGLVPLKYALDWPVMASYDELDGCAKWMGGRIPTAEEVQNIYHYVNALKTKEVEGVQVSTIAAVNGHLSNNGVEESPPPHPISNGISGAEHPPHPLSIFTDLDNLNVGFKNYHPTPVTQSGNKLSGRGDMGGAWEWTSTVLEKHQGFEAMKSYPGYTADFFDGKHNVVLGGSWATHPRIAGRKTFVNWYQRNYPFAWAGARVVRDIRGPSS